MLKTNLNDQCICSASYQMLLDGLWGTIYIVRCRYRGVDPWTGLRGFDRHKREHHERCQDEDNPAEPAASTLPRLPCGAASHLPRWRSPGKHTVRPNSLTVVVFQPLRVAETAP